MMLGARSQRLPERALSDKAEEAVGALRINWLMVILHVLLRVARLDR